MVLPSPGLGTLRVSNPKSCRDTVSEAIKIGYRHIDTAQKYGNESNVGDGSATADVAREDLFIATKIKESNLAYEDVLTTARRS